MGKLVEGVWHDVWYDTKSSGGKFVREDAGFRNWIKNLWPKYKSNNNLSITTNKVTLNQSMIFIITISF